MQFMIQISSKLYQREMIQTTTWLRSSWLWCWLVTVGFMLVVNVVEVVNSFAIQVSFSRIESRSKEEEVSNSSCFISVDFAFEMTNILCLHFYSSFKMQKPHFEHTFFNNINLHIWQSHFEMTFVVIANSSNSSTHISVVIIIINQWPAACHFNVHVVNGKTIKLSNIE